MQIMDLEEYLAKKECSFATSGYCLDKLRGNRQLKTVRGRRRFEKECAEAWMKYLANIRMMYFDARAVIWYLSVIELNILNVRMVLSGLKGGVAPEKIKERLRQTYV